MLLALLCYAIPGLTCNATTDLILRRLPPHKRRSTEPKTGQSLEVGISGT